MKNATIIELEKFQKRRDFYGACPYTIAFLYAPNGNFIIKGMSVTVDEYIRTTFPLAFWHNSYWQNGKARGTLWMGTNIYVFPAYYDVRTGKFTGEKGYVISIIDKKGDYREILHVRRMPHHWIPVLDEVATKNELADIKRAKLREKMVLNLGENPVDLSGMIDPT